VDVSGQELVVTRWRRYGKDRLYVSLADGSKVGYWDLVADEAHPETPDVGDLLAAARSSWEAESSVEVAKPSAASSSVAALDAIEPEWRDLSLNRAGAEAREQALQLKEAAPVRTFLARALMVHTDERAWRIGADGEDRVAEQLAKVSKKDGRWRFLHAIPIGKRGSDIDHVAIGPGGVFTINAKTHPGKDIWVGGDTFLVNGHRQPYIRNSRHEAARAARLLSAVVGLGVDVTGVVVPVNASDVTIKKAPDDVQVVPRRQVAKWLLGLPDQLSQDVIGQIFEVARRSTTWTTERQ
jgi:hypothetical protein